MATQQWGGGETSGEGCNSMAQAEVSDENLNTEELTYRRIAFDTLNRDSDLVPFKTWT